MPELPEVETTRRGLLAAVRGQRIASVQIRRYDLRTPIPKTFAKSIAGAAITDIRRRAKYLLIDLDSDQTILAHLGMSGSFIVVKAAGYTLKTHDHVLIALEDVSCRARPGISRNALHSKRREIPAQGRDDGLLMVFHDPRRFGVIDLMQTGEEATHPLLKNLGPEPLEPEFSVMYLAEALKRRKGPIKPVLMDQKLVVGVGNIYASEALHFCGLHPDTPAHKAAPKSAEIIAAIRKTLDAAIASGGSTLRDYVGAQNEGGYFQHQFQVYGRENDPCFRCKEPIKMSTHAGRSTYWCGKCQKIHKIAQKT